MIPYLIVSLKEFKQVVLFKLPKEKYFRAFIWYILLAAIAYGLYISYSYLYRETSFIFDLHDSLKLIGFAFIISIYFVITLIIASTTNVKAIDTDKPKDQDFIDQICVLIACHNSEDVVGDTLESALKTFRGEQLYVADNNNSPQPLNDETKKICERYGANYLYFPIGNKGNALKCALKIIDPKYKYVLTLDDDTLLPPHFNPNKKYFEEDETVSSIGFGIKMKDLNTMSEKLADFEYKLNSLRDYAKNDISTFFIVGIAGLWKRNIFDSIININPTSTKSYLLNKDLGYESPYAEDSFNGLLSRLLGYKQKMDFDNFVESYAPPRFFYSWQDFCGTSGNISGYNSLNHYAQRALRWYRSQLNRLPQEIYLMLVYNAAHVNDNICVKIIKNIKYRLEVIWQIILLYFASGIIINSYFLLGQGEYMKWIYIHAGLYLFGILSNLVTNYIIFRNRPDLKISLSVILLYPLFTTFVAFCRMIGVIGALTYFIPFRTPFRYFFCNKDIFCSRKVPVKRIEVQPKQEVNERDLIIDMVDEKTSDIKDILNKNPELITIEIINRIEDIKMDLMNEINDEKCNNIELVIR